MEAPGNELFPAWSPEGNEIVYTRQLGDSSEICSVCLDEAGGSPVIESLGVGHALWPRWSPDNKLLAYFSRQDTDGEDDEVYLLERRSGQVIRLTNRPGNDFCPSWNPNSDMIVMVSVELDGSRALRIVRASGEEEGRLALGFHRVTEPSWSPDGDSIVYAGKRSEDQEYQLFLEPSPGR